jgi:SpoIID/LytB domain protein
MTPSTVAPIVEKPVVTIENKPLAQGGWISRHLNRSFWALPADDKAHIQLGIVPSAQEVSVRSDHDFKIRVFEEHRTWDVYSPARVQWKIAFDAVVRPAIVRYYPTVQDTLMPARQKPSFEAVRPWITRGFVRAGWVGPPKMDAWKAYDQLLYRHFLALDFMESEQEAENYCKKVTAQYKNKCHVIARIELPMLGSATLRSVQGNYEKSFTGLVEIVPAPQRTVIIENVPTELLGGNPQDIPLTQSVYVLPNMQQQLSVVQSIDMQQYLESLIPEETYPSAPLQALKTQAIIARTYVYAQSSASALDHRSTTKPLEPFQMCITTACQAYHGQKQFFPNVRKAVVQTQNMVLREPQGDFAQTFYHASSGGRTETNRYAFGGVAKSYLHGTSDFLGLSAPTNLQDEAQLRLHILQKAPTYCSASSMGGPGQFWQRTVSKPALSRLAKQWGLATPIDRIEVLSRGVSGRVTKMAFYAGTQRKVLYSELAIRRALGNLPSSMMVFDIKKQGNRITSLHIFGRGQGHGVGLSQVGAIGRAERGQNYWQILQAYYPGTRLSTPMNR